MWFVPFVAALSVAGWALWVRRATWRSYWEVAASMCLVFQISATVLTSQFGDCIGALLHDMTGLWNLEDFTGNLLYVCAAAAVVRHPLIRLTDTENAKRLLYRCVRVPGALTAVILLAVFLRSRGSKIYAVNFIDLHADGWLTAYWLIQGAIIVWLLSYSSHLLLLLRSDSKHRSQCNIYLCFTITGTIGTAARMVSACLPSVQPLNADALVWYGGAVSVVGFAVGYARSWRAQMRWFEPEPRRETEPA